jgi:hypothetical protein
MALSRAFRILPLIFLPACSLSGGAGLTPTMSSQDVLNTAQAIANETRAAITPSASPTFITPTETLLPVTDTPQPTGTPTSPIVTADYNANVRSGPDESYDYIDVLLEGQQANAIGRFDNAKSGTWWYIQRIGEGLDGWVWGGAVTVAGDSTLVIGMTPPPTKTPPPKPTNTPGPTDTPGPADTPSS